MSSHGAYPGNIWFLSHLLGLQQTMTPGVHIELTTQRSGSRPEWRNSRAMAILTKPYRGFASFYQGTYCSACLFPVLAVLWKETTENWTRGYMLKDVGRSLTFDWPPAGLHVWIWNCNKPHGTLLEGTVQLWVIVHHDFWFNPAMEEEK